jgi:Transposase IS116/IS110/IS902 family
MGFEPTQYIAQVNETTHRLFSIWAQLGAKFCVRTKHLAHFVHCITLRVTDDVTIYAQRDSSIRVPLRGGQLSPVYHGENGVRTLKELARSYLTITKDLTRVMNRLKALYRSRAIPCAGTSIYVPRYRIDWLKKLTEAGVHLRAERLYLQLDMLQSLRQEARRDLLAESCKHSAAQLLRRIPCIGPIRAALLIAFIQTPHRFRTKRQL